MKRLKDLTLIFHQCTKPSIFELFIIFTGFVLVTATSFILSPTPDEGKHILNGIAFIVKKECCLHDEGPVAALHAIPIPRKDLKLPSFEKKISGGGAARVLYYDNRDSAAKIKVLSRVSTVLTYVFLLAVLWCWAQEIFSRQIARYCLILGAFSPTIIAHSGLATEDMFLTAASFFSFYLFFKYSNQPTIRNIVLLSGAVGISLLTKISALFLYLAIVIVFIVHSVHQLNETSFSIKIIKHKAIFILVLFVMPLFLLNAGYLFKGSFKTLADVQTESETLNKFKNSWVGALPLPIPEGYIKAIDFNRVDTKMRRESKAPGFMLNEVYLGSKPSYFVVAFLLKTSGILLLFITLGIYKFTKSKTPPFLGLSLFFFPLFFLIANIIFNDFNVGVRYMLPAYPFLVLAAGFSFRINWVQYVKPLLVVYVLITIITFPNYLAFFNFSSFFAKKENLLIDSNLDWGQMNYLIGKDAADRKINNICVQTMWPLLVPRSVNVRNVRYPQNCVFYLSKTLKRFSTTDKYYQLFKRPNYELGEVIEVYDITSDNDLENKFINKWRISAPFPEPHNLSDLRLIMKREKTLKYKDIKTEFGMVDVKSVYPDKNLDNSCVIAKSRESVLGQLLISADDQIVLFNDRGIYASKESPGKLIFYQLTTGLQQTQAIRALVCNDFGDFQFMIGYIPFERHAD